jgi:hypothetical protein
MHVSRVFTGESGVRVTFKVLDSLSTAPWEAFNLASQGPARMPPASRGLPSSGDPSGDPDRIQSSGRTDTDRRL